MKERIRKEGGSEEEKEDGRKASRQKEIKNKKNKRKKERKCRKECKVGMGERKRRREGDCLKAYRHGTTPALSLWSHLASVTHLCH